MKKRQKFSFLALTALLVLSLLSGCGSDRLAIQRGVLSGRITDKDGFVVSGAVVKSGRSLYSATSNSSGDYYFTSLDGGFHNLTVEQNGYYIASQTVKLEPGEAVKGINFVLEPIDGYVSCSVIKRSQTEVLFDISCNEPMSVVLIRHALHDAITSTAPTEQLTHHQIAIDNLKKGQKYFYSIVGTTKDGRRFATKEASFNIAPFNDVEGKPEAVSSFKARQGENGPVLTWVYQGEDALSGFRLYRAGKDGKMQLLANEELLFDNDTSYVDISAHAGKLYSYQIECVDLCGEVSLRSEAAKITPSGKLSENVVWSKKNSPVTIEGSIIVPKNRILTIEPGVVARFKTREGSTEKAQIVVNGAIMAAGSEEEPIKLISASSASAENDWGGIYFNSESGETTGVFKNLIIAGARQAILFKTNNFEAENITMRRCRCGIKADCVDDTKFNNISAENCDIAFCAEYTENCTLNNFKVLGAQKGVWLVGNKGFALSTFDIRGAKQYAIDAADKTETRIKNGVLQSFETGLKIAAAGGSFEYLTIDAANGVVIETASKPALKNNIIVNFHGLKTGCGIEDKTATGRSYPYNCIYGFLPATLNCNQLGAAILNTNPLFIGGDTYESFNYHLKASSPVKTASERSGQPGAYGAAEQ